MKTDILAFDVWGDYAYFRRGYTTTSTISYPFPSRTTIAGFIAGILGFPRDSYYDMFQEDNSKIGLRIINPINKIRLNLNYVNTKKNLVLSKINQNENRTQVNAEFLKNVKYRIYVSLDDKEVMSLLTNFIENHRSVYTPYLGITECLANFEFIGNFHAEKKSGREIRIDSILLKDKCDICIEKNRRYGIIKSPGFMNKDRSVKTFLSYYYESQGKDIKVKSCEYYKINGDNIVLY